MKLSEMPTRKAAECMAELAAPIGVLLKDPSVTEYLKKAARQKASVQLLADAVVPLMTVFLRDHFDETAKVLSILTDKTLGEIENQPLKATISDVKASVDDELIGFFSK